MIPANESFIKMYDSPWLKRQVKTHLFFGEHKGKYYYLLAIAIYIAAITLFSSKFLEVKGLIFQDDPRVAFFATGILMAIIFGNYKTNAILWAAIKVTVFFASFIFVLVGAINLLRDDPADIELIILGLAWFPGPEFVNKITEHQKYLTLARVAITVPVVILTS